MSTMATAKMRVRLDDTRMVPLETEWTTPVGVPEDGPSQADLLDRALDVADRDGVPLVVLPLHEDEGAHDVVQDHALAGQRERGKHEAQARDHRPQVEQLEDQEHHRPAPPAPG